MSPANLSVDSRTVFDLAATVLPMTLDVKRPHDLGVVLLGGTQGAGKTTVLNTLLSAAGLRAHVIQNDVGQATIDGSVLTAVSPDRMTLLSAGCVGCQDLNAPKVILEHIRQLPLAQRPEVVLFETTGVANTSNVRALIEGIGLPVCALVLLDVKHFRENFNANFLQGQVEAASVVLLTWWQRSDAAEPDFDDPQVREALQYVASRRPGVMVSFLDRSGLPVGEPFVIENALSSDSSQYTALPAAPVKRHLTNLLVKPGVSYDEFKITLQRSLGHDGVIYRCKGTVGGVDFHIVHNDWVVTGEQSGEHATRLTVTSNVRLDASVLAAVVVPEANDLFEVPANDDPRYLRACVNVVQRALTQFPSTSRDPVMGTLLVDCEADGVERHLTAPGFPTDLRNRYMDGLISFRWRSMQALLRGDADGDPKLGYYQRRLGSYFTYLLTVKPDDLSRSGILEAVRKINPAAVYFKGLAETSHPSEMGSFTDDSVFWMKTVRRELLAYPPHSQSLLLIERAAVNLERIGLPEWAEALRAE